MKDINFVVFLDVDGVLNTRTTCEHSPSGIYVGVDGARLEILANSIKDVKADGVVLTTTWKNMRENDEDYIYLLDKLSAYDIKVLGKTEDDYVTEREGGILKYLKEHPSIEEYVIIDDQHFGFEKHTKLWESFIDTREKGIENSVAASKTPSIAVILFMDAIGKYK